MSRGFLEFLYFFVTATIAGILLGYFLRVPISRGFRSLGGLSSNLLALLHIWGPLEKRHRKLVAQEFSRIKLGYKDIQIDLSSSYIHLRALFKDGQAKEVANNESQQLEELTKKNRKLAILGHPGGGKTTLLQKLTMSVALGDKDPYFREKLFPVLLFLRNLRDRTIEAALDDYLKQFKFQRGRKYLRKKLLLGNCLISFDGLDEVADPYRRNELMQELSNFIDRYPKNRFIITSRIEDFHQERLPTNFTICQICELNSSEINEFVHIFVSQEEDPNKLIRLIKSNPGLSRLSETPLMLAILCFVYQENNQRLPSNRVRVYEKCVDLMLEDRDAGKGIYEYRNRFGSEDKKLLCRKLAYDFFTESKQAFPKEELYSAVQSLFLYVSNLHDPTQIQAFISELTTANGILKHIDPNTYSFSHLTFQEFFTAQEIMQLKGEKWNNFIAHINDPVWREIILFVAGMQEDASALIEMIMDSEDLNLTAQTLAFTTHPIKPEICYKLLQAMIKKIAEDRTKAKPLLDAMSLLALAQTQFMVEVYEFFVKLQRQSRKDRAFEKDLQERINQIPLIGRVNADGNHPGMVYVPSGKFLAMDDGRPMYTAGFWIDVYPVTNARWKIFCEQSGYSEYPSYWVKDKFPDSLANHPVVDISLKHAEAYASWAGKRLPTELEWEKSARGTDGFKYPWGQVFKEENCNTAQSGKKKIQTVGSNPNNVSPFGCFDMVGNVWEWTNSYYTPWYDEDKRWRILKGGSCEDFYHEARCASRKFAETDNYRSMYLGFRCVADTTPALFEKDEEESQNEERSGGSSTTSKGSSTTSNDGKIGNPIVEKINLTENQENPRKTKPR